MSSSIVANFVATTLLLIHQGRTLVMMLGGTLPVPLYVMYEKQMGFERLKARA